MKGRNYAEDESIPHMVAKYSMQGFLWLVIIIAESVYIGVTLNTFIYQQSNLKTKTEIGNLNELPGRELPFPRVIMCPVFLAEKKIVSTLSFTSCTSFPAGKSTNQYNSDCGGNISPFTLNYTIDQRSTPVSCFEINKEM
jgi:hypothetical protein